MREPRKTTIHGHDPHCALCGLRVYGLWVSKEPPPFGCSDGLDATPWECAHVIASLQMATILVDELGGELKPHHHRLVQVIGERRASSKRCELAMFRRPAAGFAMSTSISGRCRPPCITHRLCKATNPACSSPQISASFTHPSSALCRPRLLPPCVSTRGCWHGEITQAKEAEAVHGY